jgi:hypothetical protein
MHSEGERGVAREILFLVEDADEGGFVARALGHSILTEADSWDELKRAIRDAVRCHFDEGVEGSIGLVGVAGRIAGMWVRSMAALIAYG